MLRKPRLAIVVGVAALAVLAGSALATRTRRGPAYTVSVPSLWSDQPGYATLAYVEIASSPVLPRGSGVQVSVFSHLSASDTYAATVEIDAPGRDAPARPQTTSALALLRGQLARAGVGVTTWDESDDGKIVTVRFAGGVDRFRLVGRALVLLDQGRRTPVLRVFAAVCLHRGASMQKPCASLVDSLATVVPVSHRRPL